MKTKLTVKENLVCLGETIFIFIFGFLILLLIFTFI